MSSVICPKANEKQKYSIQFTAININSVQQTDPFVLCQGIKAHDQERLRAGNCGAELTGLQYLIYLAHLQAIMFIFLARIQKVTNFTLRKY